MLVLVGLGSPAAGGERPCARARRGAVPITARYVKRRGRIRGRVSGVGVGGNPEPGGTMMRTATFAAAVAVFAALSLAAPVAVEAQWWNV